MKSLDILNKYAELNALWMEKKAMLDIYTGQSLTGEMQINPKELQLLINQTNKQIDELESKAKQLYAEYFSAAWEEARQQAAEKLKNGVNEIYSNNTGVVQENKQAGVKK